LPAQPSLAASRRVAYRRDSKKIVKRYLSIKLILKLSCSQGNSLIGFPLVFPANCEKITRV
jgi:hypothetical protein